MTWALADGHQEGAPKARDRFPTSLRGTSRTRYNPPAHPPTDSPACFPDEPPFQASAGSGARGGESSNSVGAEPAGKRAAVVPARTGLSASTELFCIPSTAAATACNQNIVAVVVVDRNSVGVSVEKSPLAMQPDKMPIPRTTASPACVHTTPTSRHWRWVQVRKTIGDDAPDDAPRCNLEV